MLSYAKDYCLNLEKNMAQPQIQIDQKQQSSRPNPTSAIHIAEAYQADLDKAIGILKGAGCQAVYLFGSLATQETGRKSDIDLAIRGCPPGKFFHLFGKLYMELDHQVDLVNLDSNSNRDFARLLEKEGELIQIA